MSFRNTLREKDFIITLEVAPPKGIKTEQLYELLRPLKGKVDAINITDFQGASARMSALGTAISILNEGFDVILHITGRDRNRIAIQGEILSAYHLGVRNILALTGDHPALGDNPEAKAVYDLDSVGILTVVKSFSEGKDLHGNPLDTKVDILVGAVVNPSFEPQELQVISMRRKIEAGAKFFQTQAVFEINKWLNFKGLLNKYKIDTRILMGIIPVRSVRMAQFMNEHIPGIVVPPDIIHRVSSAREPREEGLKIAAETIKKVKEEHLADGIHIMPILSLKQVPLLLDMAGI